MLADEEVLLWRELYKLENSSECDCWAGCETCWERDDRILEIKRLLGLCSDTEYDFIMKSRLERRY